MQGLVITREANFRTGLGNGARETLWAAHHLFRTLRVEKYVGLAAHLARQLGVVLPDEPSA